MLLIEGSAARQRSRLERGVGRDLPSTLAFNYPTAVALAGFLDVEDAPDTVPPAPAPAAARAADVDADDLSEDELAALLARKLESLR